MRREAKSHEGGASTKTPPQSLEAERAVLGAVLLDGGLAPTLLDVPAEVFYKESHRALWHAINRLVQRGDPVDVLTTAESLRANGRFEEIGGHTLLAVLQEEGILATQFDSYLRIVQEYALRRELIRASREALEAAYDETALIEETVSRHALAVSRLESFRGEEIIDPRTFAAEIREDRPLPTIATGLVVYDGMAFAPRDGDGGLTLGDLHILAARPQLGKTATVLQVAHHVTHTLGLTALFTSAEMSRAQIGHRLRRLATPDQIEASGFFIRDPTGPTVQDVVTMIRQAHARYAIQLAVIDHVQELRPTRGYQNRRDLEIREIADELRNVAKSLGIAVLAASQLNREVERRHSPRPLLSDLRDGGALEEMAASVTFLWAPDPDDEDKEVVPVVFSRRKYRHGPKNEWPATFLKSSGRMEART